MMRLTQTIVTTTADIGEACASLAACTPDLVLVFGSVDVLRAPLLLDSLRGALPNTVIAGCSTAGEILADGVRDKSCVLTAVSFETTRCAIAATPMGGIGESHAAGASLARQIAAHGTPQAVLLFGRGTDMNGSALIDGLLSVLPPDTPVAGGLAGDDGAFENTLVIAPDNGMAAVAVGLYGDGLSMRQGSYGGWNPFGPARRVTAASGSILHRLDEEPALAIYKRYLGDHARDLPASGLLFPFEIVGEDMSRRGLVRTILGVDEASGSLILAGDVAEGALLRMMSASPDALVDGAQRAARACVGAAGRGDRLALLVSCVGRKLVMGDRVEEEVEVVAETLGRGLTVSGFYSYGELSSPEDGGRCRLHNQTMTVAVLGEH